MSIQTICDKCGAPVQDSDDDAVACEIYFNGSEEPYYIAEDLCDGCMEAIRNTIDATIARQLTRKRAQRKDGTEDENVVEDSRESD